MLYPDIYYFPQWSELNSVLDGGTAEHYEFQCDYGQIYYPYIKKKISTKVNNQTFYDTVTPYGFNGPVVIAADDKEKLLEEFEKNFNSYCADKHIVAEYVRFSPWLKNHEDFEKYYSLKHNNQTLFIDLKKDFFTEEYSHSCRNNIRKAAKNSITVKFDYEGDTLKEFIKLYDKMAVKNSVSSYYSFDEMYFKNTMDKMKGNIFIIYAVFEGIIISSAMCLHHDKYLHYHLMGNDYEYITLGANSLLCHEAAKWGQEHGMSEFHLGGAFSESLLRFKKNFTRTGFLDFYVGKRIRDRCSYNSLIELLGRNSSGYFPEYRNNQ